MRLFRHVAFAAALLTSGAASAQQTTEVKKPAESKYPWDYYKLRATIPATEAFRPLNEGGCPLVSG